MRTLVKPALLVVMLAGLSGVMFAPAQQKDKDKKDDKAAVFELYKDNSDMFRFRLVSGDDKLAISSHGFKTKEEMLKVIEAVRKETPKAKVDDQTKK